jgi:hypothetical protein
MLNEPPVSNLNLDKFPLIVPEENALMAQWEKKAVHKTLLIDDMEQPSGWQVFGIGEMSYTSDRARDGKKSLRFRTSLRDEEHYRQNRSEWGSFSGTQGGSTSILLPFEEPQDWSAYNRISFWVYVHPASMPTYTIYLQMECNGVVYNAAYPRKSHFVQDLKPGQWNHVLFEIPHLKRDQVTSFRILQMLIGHHPEEEGIITYDFDQLELQLVDTDQYEGWEVAPDKFAFNHIGYRPADRKVAMAGEGAGDKFQLLDMESKVVYSNTVKTIRNEQGMFRVVDFTDFRENGEYRIRSGSLVSNPFPIGEEVWTQPLFKAINFFFCERCGFEVPGIHLECHKDWQGFRGETKKIINGGWHDAGDLSQGSWRTAMSTYAMLLNLEELEKAGGPVELAGRIREEIAWGLQWLLKTRFGDGYHMSFSVMRIYTDNEVGTIDDVVSPAVNIPWENFLAAAVQCKAASMLEKSYPELAILSREAALEDWEAAVSSRDRWDLADYREAAWGATSSVLLGRMTGDQKYSEYAIRFGRLLMQCQEQQFIDGMPITGYFYTHTERKRVIHNHHAAFEEAPLIALSMLCEEFPEHEDWIQWYGAAVLHSDFFMKRGSRIAAPYELVPNSVWKRSEIISIEDEERRTDMLRQFDDGTPLVGDFVLRTFPIYPDNLFHGNTNVHMSSTWALAEASRLRNDSEGYQLVGKQLEWVLGANPFGQSLMYGVGYDFAPHFAYCLKDIVGSLPVGMDCLSGDQPYWSASNDATHKEIWVEPVNRFLGALSIYNSVTHPMPGSEVSGKEIKIRTDTRRSGEDLTIRISATGSGNHEIGLKAFNLASSVNERMIDLSESGSADIQFELKIKDLHTPFVAVVTVDNDPESRQEIVGSMVEEAF